MKKYLLEEERGRGGSIGKKINGRGGSTNGRGKRKERCPVLRVYRVSHSKVQILFLVARFEAFISIIPFILISVAKLFNRVYHG